jgi:hypothetical protein
MKRKTKAAAVLLALVMAVFALTGCTKTAPAAITLYDTETLYIEREGAETRVYDRVGNADYTFTSHRVRAGQGTAAQISEAKTTTETDTIKLQTVYGVIIVTDKTTGTTLYVKGAR